MAPDPAPEDAPLSRYVILQDVDGDGITFRRIGEVEDVRGADDGYRKYFADPASGPEGVFVVVSATNFKLRRRVRTVGQRTEEVALSPLPPPAAPEAE